MLYETVDDCSRFGDGPATCVCEVHAFDDDDANVEVAGIRIGKPTKTMSLTLISNLRRQRLARMHSRVARTTSGYLEDTAESIVDEMKPRLCFCVCVWCVCLV